MTVCDFPNYGEVEPDSFISGGVVEFKRPLVSRLQRRAVVFEGEPIGRVRDRYLPGVGLVRGEPKEVLCELTQPGAIGQYRLGTVDFDGQPIGVDRRPGVPLTSESASGSMFSLARPARESRDSSRRSGLRVWLRWMAYSSAACQREEFDQPIAA